MGSRTQGIERKGIMNCSECKYNRRCTCSLLNYVRIPQLTEYTDKCILDYEDIKSIHEGSLDYFIFSNNPKKYLSYLGYKDKENYPKSGDIVLALSGSFEYNKLLRVHSEDGIQIFLSDIDNEHYLEEEAEYCVEKDVWWNYLFKLRI